MVVVGAIAFAAILFFLPWYGASTSSPIGTLRIGGDTSGWQTFTNSRWLWLLTIIVALGSVAVEARERRRESSLEPGAIVTGLGGLSSLFILYRIIDHPGGGATAVVGLSHLSYSYGIKIGIWLALLAALGITAGGYLQMRAEGAEGGAGKPAKGRANDAFFGLVTVGGDGFSEAESSPLELSASRASESPPDSAPTPAEAWMGTAPAPVPVAAPVAVATPVAAPLMATAPPAAPAPSAAPAFPAAPPSAAPATATAAAPVAPPIPPPAAPPIPPPATLPAQDR